MAKITWMNGSQEVSVEVPRGTRLLEALRAGEYFISAPCGGTGRCGKCRVEVEGCLNDPTAAEYALLGEELDRGIRLACTAQVLGDCRILSRPQDGKKTEALGRDRGQALALAVDLGTTTMDARLLVKENGEILAQGSIRNPQSPYGADVISRISSVQEEAGNLIAMRDLVWGAVKDLAQRLTEACGADPSRIEVCVVAGNTVMTHIFWGEDPTSLGRMPFAPVFLEARTKKAAELGLPFAESCTVSTVPCISAFLGGDVTAGLLVCPMGETERVLLVDIGTNGEMVYHADGMMRGCAAAAGPALEGGGISCGCAAIPGAIRHVTGDAAGFEIQTVGDEAPVGLCGSGIVDAAALLTELEILDPSGFLEEPMDPFWQGCITGEDGSRAWEISSGVRLTQKDIRELQLTKAAIAAGIECLCGTQVPDTVYLCGGLGGAIDPAQACRIDLLPAGFEKIVVPAGNTSLLGAQTIALHPEKMEQAEQIARSVTALNLAETAGFQESFAEHMAFGEW